MVAAGARAALFQHRAQIRTNSRHGLNAQCLASRLFQRVKGFLRIPRTRHDFQMELRVMMSDMQRMLDESEFVYDRLRSAATAAEMLEVLRAGEQAALD